MVGKSGDLENAVQRDPAVHTVHWLTGVGTSF